MQREVGAEINFARSGFVAVVETSAVDDKYGGTAVAGCCIGRQIEIGLFLPSRQEVGNIPFNADSWRRLNADALEIFSGRRSCQPG